MSNEIGQYGVNQFTVLVLQPSILLTMWVRRWNRDRIVARALLTVVILLLLLAFVVVAYDAAAVQKMNRSWI